MEGSGIPSTYWAALMRFAQQVGAEDPVNQIPSQVRMMSEENRTWLTQAMSDLVKQTDPILKMKGALKVLIDTDCHSSAESELDAALEALDTLADLCNQIDTATDFYKIGGFRLLYPLLASPTPELRSGAANLIGELAQNNPFCQEKLKEARLIEVLEEMLATDTDISCRTKALYAISCLVRNNPEMIEEFLRLDGLSYLLGALQSGVDKLILKSSFLLSSVLTKVDHKETAVNMGLVDQLAALLATDLQWEAREHVTAALLNLVVDCPKAQKCQKPDLCLQVTLKNRVSLISEDEHKDELSYAKEILAACWPSQDTFAEILTVDR